MSSSRRSIVRVASTIALGACAWRDTEPAVRVIRDPAGQRAATLLDAADTAIAHGQPEVAYTAVASAYDQVTPSPEIAYRIARLADQLDDVGTAARAYRRYLSLTPDGPAADSVRARLLALVAGPMRVHMVTAAQQVSAAGEVERTPVAAPAPAHSHVSKRSSSAKRHSHHVTRHRRKHRRAA